MVLTRKREAQWIRTRVGAPRSPGAFRELCRRDTIFIGVFVELRDHEPRSLAIPRDTGKPEKIEHRERHLAGSVRCNRLVEHRVEPILEVVGRRHSAADFLSTESRREDGTGEGFSLRR